MPVPADSADLKMLDNWAALETTPTDGFCVFIDRLLLKSPLADAPQICCYTLLVTELGTEIIALTLRYRFDCATIVADNAIELYEICLPHTYILCSFALFFYPFLTLDSHLYTNLYTIYYEMEDFYKAENALAAFEEVFPNNYMPHALWGTMLITIENKKEQDQRDFSAAFTEYETAGNMIRSSDETTYYQQLGTLIDSLRQNGWL